RGSRRCRAAVFRAEQRNAATVAQVCQPLDGIPLAAARVQALSVKKLEARLDARFRLLTLGSRTALPRQQTLRALIDWSYDLWSPSERELLRRHSDFAGGLPKLRKSVSHAGTNRSSSAGSSIGSFISCGRLQRCFPY